MLYYELYKDIPENKELSAKGAIKITIQNIIKSG